MAEPDLATVGEAPTRCDEALAIEREVGQEPGRQLSSVGRTADVATYSVGAGRLGLVPWQPWSNAFSRAFSLSHGALVAARGTIRQLRGWPRHAHWTNQAQISVMLS